MQDIIQKIIEIDKMAQTMTSEAQQLRTETEQSIRKDKDKLRSDYLDRARKRIAKTAATEEGFQKQSLEEIEKKYAATADSLRAMYDKNRTQWVDQLFKKVIGG